MQSILLITSGQPSANPRLVKEAMALDQSGYKVIVLFVPISPWADEFDQKLFIRLPQIKFINVGYHPKKNPLKHRWVRVRRKLFSTIFKYLGDTFNVVDYSTILFGQELLEEAIKYKADLYIAHNLGALPVAIKAAELHNAKVGFDAEDFHRGEFQFKNLEQQKTEVLENKYIPKVDYITAASPLIGESYKSIFPEIKPVVINNVFSVRNLSKVQIENNSSLKLFWFSQTIGKKRGIENIIQAIGMLPETAVTLTLLGNISVETKEYLFSVAVASNVVKDRIIFISPVAEDEIFKTAAACDIGIGAEIPYCTNREYCLTNKIFTYLIAGNALVLSDTLAQNRFLKEYPGVGSIYKYNDPSVLANILKEYITNPSLLAQHKENARNLALSELNWENESQKFLETVKAVLQS
jgi:glycosyltransferase involved in cell wall biosynthesis